MASVKAPAPQEQKVEGESSDASLAALSSRPRAAATRRQSARPTVMVSSSSSSAAGGGFELPPACGFHSAATGAADRRGLLLLLRLAAAVASTVVVVAAASDAGKLSLWALVKVVAPLPPLPPTPPRAAPSSSAGAHRGEGRRTWCGRRVAILLPVRGEEKRVLRRVVVLSGGGSSSHSGCPVLSLPLSSRPRGAKPNLYVHNQARPPESKKSAMFSLKLFMKSAYN
uniref:Uncharacterized protein n=1 Tax=Oryza nivara TaxID=4536 RepID=A0A0E0IAW8_ORYNI